MGSTVRPPHRRACRFDRRGRRGRLMSAATRSPSTSSPRFSISSRPRLPDDWVAAVPMILTHVHTWLEDFPAVERETAAALAMPELSEPVKLVHVRGAQALAWFEAGHLADAADAAGAADAEARRRGFGQHFSPSSTCARWPGSRWSGATSTPPSSSPSRRCRYRRGGGPSLSSWRCWNGPGSGPPAGRSARRCPRSRRRAWSWPGPGRCCWRGPMSWRRCCACHSATCAPPLSSRPGCPPPDAACCWPGSRSPRATTTPRAEHRHCAARGNLLHRHRAWRTSAEDPCGVAADRSRALHRDDPISSGERTALASRSCRTQPGSTGRPCSTGTSSCPRRGSRASACAAPGRSNAGPAAAARVPPARPA